MLLHLISRIFEKHAKGKVGDLYIWDAFSHWSSNRKSQVQRLFKILIAAVVEANRSIINTRGILTFTKVLRKEMIKNVL